MLTILSPAKTFKAQKNQQAKDYEPLTFVSETNRLIDILRGYKPSELAKLMKMSDKLATLNYERYQTFNEKYAKGYEAIHYFYGEAYKGIGADTLSSVDLAFIQEHVRILSGLYGIVKPQDIIKEYRLEMATRLKNVRGKDLYDYWQEGLTKQIIKELQTTKGDRVLLNLASKEYSKALDLETIAKEFPVMDLNFKEHKEGTYKIVGMYVKRARGLMIRYLAENQIVTIKALKQFNKEGYSLNTELSSENCLTFTR